LHKTQAFSSFSGSILKNLANFSSILHDLIDTPNLPE
jgi:hypothetical protein